MSDTNEADRKNPPPLMTEPAQWRNRIGEAVQKKGYASTVEFLKGFPNVPFGKLYRLICQDRSDNKELDIGVARFRDAIFDGAMKEGATRWVTLDMLVRILSEHLGKGWDRGSDARMRRGKAYSEWRFPWRTDTDYEDTLATCKRIWTRLEATAPPDWRPKGNDDPIIVDAFDKEWPLEVGH